MFDLGFGAGELLLIAMLALIFVGPKDLPKLMYEIGKKISYLRGLGDDFRRGMNEIAYQEELVKLKQEIETQKSSLEQAASSVSLTAEASEPSPEIIDTPVNVPSKEV